MSTLTQDYSITVTEGAQGYLAELLAKQEDVVGVRLYVDKPGTPGAETLLTYCREENKEGCVLYLSLIHISEPTRPY